MDRQHKGQKKKVKRTNNYLPNITQKIKDQAIMIPLTSGVNPREYNEKWTGEIFNVTHRIMRGGFPIYRLKDLLIIRSKIIYIAGRDPRIEFLWSV
jgi:hypothetical protein